MTIREWLDTPCKESEIAKIREGDREYEYIPIGIVESILDEKFVWGTANFKFQILKTGNFWYASGSVQLIVEMGEDYHRSMVGGCTMVINSRDTNMDYEATVLSFCISNAAKKLGRRFGRHLNGRMEKGETAIILDKPHQPEIIDPKDARWDKMLADCTSLEELSNYKGQAPADKYMQRVREISSQKI